jgi:phage-related baseplate assembly protein
MLRFLPPDLAQLPPPQLIEVIDYEQILIDQKQWVLDKWAEVQVLRPDLPPLDTLGLETEPMTILLEAFAYRETILRALVNDKARAVLLAKAIGSDLDHVGALYPTMRAIIVPATDTLPAIYESDAAFRRRVQLTPEAFSVAGPQDAYIYWALSVDPSTIMDAYAYRYDDKGNVHIVVAGFDAADVPDATIDALWTQFARTDITPLTDVPRIVRASRIEYQVTGDIYIPPGPMALARAAAAKAAVFAYGQSRMKITWDVHRAGIVAAAMVQGVENVVLKTPAADIPRGDETIPKMTDVTFRMVILD